MANIWEGNLVRLRAVEPSDWELFSAWNLDSDAAREGYEVEFPQSDEAAKRWAEAQSVQVAESDAFRWVIGTLDGKAVGTINTHSCNARNGTFGYGVFVSEEYRRKGYAGEAIKLVLSFYFEELRYQKATVHVYSFNKTSAILHERLGFTLEGRLRSMVYSGGQLFDIFVFGITADEYRAKHSGLRSQEASAGGS
jgi:RimJ/RimL family protein N-acetyltransferase